MRTVLKYFGVALGVVLTLALVGVAGLYAWSNGQLKSTVPIVEHDIVVPTDDASISRGEHLSRSLAKCVDCHGEDMGGFTLVDNGPIGRIAGPNLTPGRGGILEGYDDEALERAIRHGIARDGRRLLIMPAMDYQYLSDEDTGAIIAYLRTLTPVDRESVPIRIGPLARALHAAGQMPLFPYDAVTHRDRSVPPVPVDSTAAYGKYIGDVGCAGCHDQSYSGGKIPGAPPDWPVAANISRGGIGHYSFADFDRALREGVRPDGSQINPAMPIPATKLMTDLEMVAVWKYLQSLPPKQFGER